MKIVYTIYRLQSKPVSSTNEKSGFTLEIVASFDTEDDAIKHLEEMYSIQSYVILKTYYYR